MTPLQLKISIITVNYNHAEGLAETIASVAGQSYAEIEHIVIDGGSTDSSTDVIESNRHHLAYAVSEKDKGVFDAMNKGIKQATGDYLLFVNSGDKLATEHVINNCVAYGFDKDLIIADMVFVNEGQRRDWKPEHLLTFDLFYFYGIPHPSTFIKKELFDLVGLYDDELKIVSDWKFFLLAVCKHNCSYKRIDITVSEFIEGGISTQEDSVPQILAERKKVIEAHFSAFLPNYEELWAARRQLRKLRYTIKIKKFLGIR
ncbi:glycosyltransferase family 2 protein [Pedobacter xixiisoli]|uniref:Glycosyltransferase involved in cell wall bisynthesis n=1 Tax=Pedobacter xixiisoli TaxID=1476464 RepID=A0A286AD75_9SPHI|nr:glycosyltransferase family 2 protein [Pedobacter xixiisoli]SOD19854.1 Glycosyltransferase involved in cell wall bisynthesis [Pedobacter xixiisoli]